jgi:hypothetical protein
MATTTTRHLILWVKQGDPPSERARLSSESWGRVVPSDVDLEVRQVSVDAPEVSRVPCLHFMLGDDVVYSLEGDITLEAVVSTLRRLG